MAETKITMVCSECGSTEVVADAYAAWDADKQDWTVANVFDKGAYCDTCEGETRITSAPLESVTTSDSPRCGECKDKCTDDEMNGINGRLLCEPCADKEGAK